MSWQELLDTIEASFREAEKTHHRTTPTEEVAQTRLALQGCRLARGLGEVGVLDSAEDERRRSDMLALAMGGIGLLWGWHAHARVGDFGPFSREAAISIIADYGKSMRPIAEYVEEGTRARKRSKNASKNASKPRKPLKERLDILEKYDKFVALHHGETRGVYAKLQKESGWSRETVKGVVESRDQIQQEPLATR